MVDATSYREPLLDSQFSDFSEDSFVVRSGKDVVSSTSMSMPSTSCTHQNRPYFFKKKRFEDVPEEKEEVSDFQPPSFTEVVTGDKADSGVATSRSTNDSTQ